MSTEFRYPQICEMRIYILTLFDFTNPFTNMDPWNNFDPSMDK